MRPAGSPALRALMRRLAIDEYLAGEAPAHIAEMFNVRERSVWRWLASFRQGGWEALEPREPPGRPRVLTDVHLEQIRTWLTLPPTDFGFVGQRWTAPRLARVMASAGGPLVHPNYLIRWLRRHGITPQRPQRVARERDPVAVARWLEQDWPRIKKTPGPGERPWPLLTRQEPPRHRWS